MVPESPIRTLASRGVTVVIVNQSPDQLELDSDCTQLWNGKWANSAAQSVVPEVIRPHESILLHCKSAGVAKGIEGSVTYHLAGPPPHDRVRFTWKNRYFGQNAYKAQTTREGYAIEVVGGEGAHAVVVFVFGPLYSS